MSGWEAWKHNKLKYFDPVDTSIETLRRPWPQDAPYNLVETSYFGFSIPEENINGEIYHWFHPKLGVVSGGVFIFRGIKQTSMEPEYIKYENYMPIPEDITDCTYANGITIRMRKPQEQFDISFDDPEDGTSLRLTTTAIMPAAFRPSGGHITQALKNTGVLVLKGREYKISGYFTRDRSWGDPRAERQLDIPPIGWHVGVFDENLAFHVTAFDSPELNPVSAKRYPGIGAGQNYIWGYLWKEGQLLGIKSARKLTHRADDGCATASMTIDMIDENDETHHIEGTVEARYPLNVWPQITCYFCLTRWTYKGLTGYGDTQEVLYARFYNEWLRR